MSIGSARKSYQNEDKCLLQSHTWQVRLVILQQLEGKGCCHLLPETSLENMSAYSGDKLKVKGSN